jgi:hypothetical protein
VLANEVGELDWTLLTSEITTQEEGEAVTKRVAVGETLEILGVFDMEPIRKIHLAVGWYEHPEEMDIEAIWESIHWLTNECNGAWGSEDEFEAIIEQGNDVCIDYGVSGPALKSEFDFEPLGQLIEEGKAFGIEYGMGIKYLIALEHCFEILEVVSAINEQISVRMPGKSVSVGGDGRLHIVMDNGELIHPEIMSSGEKQYLLIFWQLMEKLNEIGPRFGMHRFSAQPLEGLIMIDEPEISLHANWQRGIVSDLEEAFIQKRRKEAEDGLERADWDLSNGTKSCRFLIATHSPQVVGNHLHRTQGIGLGPKERVE